MSQQSSFFGHPIGLRTLFLTEMWERMSYYGMRGIMVLFMTAGLTGSNPGLTFSAVEANAIYGAYIGLVYFMVVPGGWLADNIFGYQKAVLLGAIIIAIGHYTLAIPFEQTFFLGLLFVILGTGLLKGNISAIVGKMYDNNDSMRDAGYTIFYMSINIGSVLGFLICGWLGENIGWHWGFGAAGIGMTFGVYQFVKYRHLLGSAGAEPNEMDPDRRKRLLGYFYVAVGIIAIAVLLALLGVFDIDPVIFASSYAYFLVIVAGLYFLYLFLLAGLNPSEKKNLLLLFFLFIGAAAFWSGFDQSGGSLTIFARDFTDLNLFGFELPISWMNLANPIFVVIFAPVFAGIWTNLAIRNLDPSLPMKFAIGLLFMCLSFILMVYAVNAAMQYGQVGIQWLLITYLLHTWGELALSPIGLSAFSRYAPKKYAGQMFGLWFTASAIGGVLAGLLGGEATGEGLESMTPIFSFMIKYYLVIGVILALLSFVIKPAEKESAN